MADNETYISDLDQIIEIKPADSFIVETTEGTKRILWQDIIVGQDNVDFYNLITQNQVDVLTLSSNVTTLSSNQTAIIKDVAALSAADTLRDQYGYAYAEITEYNGSNPALSQQLVNVLSSTNVTNVVVGGGGSFLNITLNSNIDVSRVIANVTFNYSVSVNPDDGTSYQTYTPVITRDTTSNSILVSVDTIVHTISAEQIATTVSLSKDVVSQSVATGATSTLVDTLSISSLGSRDISPPVVGNTSTSNTNLSYLTDVTISSSPKTVTFDSTEYISNWEIQGKTTTGDPVNFGINVTFRY